MNLEIVPKLIESEPFEVAMGGNLVTVFYLLNSKNNQRLAAHLVFANFLEISPQKDFSILVSCNSLRDPTDYKLWILNNQTGSMQNMGPIHSVPEHQVWQDNQTIQFVTRVRPSISRLKSDFEFDLAKPTVTILKKDGDNFRITFDRFA